MKMEEVVTQIPDLYTEDFDLPEVDADLDDLLMNISRLNASIGSKGYMGRGPYLNDETPRYVFLVANLVIFVFGLLGNALVIYIIALFAKVRNKSVANYYIWNLAFADILCIAALPLFGYNTFTSHWPFGNIFCKIGYVLRDINKFTSVFTLVALSVDRYLATFHSSAYLRTIQVGKIICTVVWVISFILATPYLLFAQTTGHMKGKTSCRLMWPSSPDAIYMKFWTYFQLVVGLLLPFTVIIGSYILLIRRFRKLVKLQAKSRIRRSGRKMTQTVIAVVLTFLFCQAPYHAVNIANIRMMERYSEEGTKPSQQAMRLYTYINGLAQVLVYISSCCNPVIYALLNENFRKMEEDLESFLTEELEVGEETLQEMKNENISKNVIVSMDDKDLQEYVKKKGDRISLKTFCSKTKQGSKKLALLEKLRSKLSERNDSRTANKRARVGNRNACKSTRKVEFGWIVCDGLVKRQVPTKMGGGKRKLDVDKSATKKEFHSLAINLFFPQDANGNNTSRHHGPLSNFDTAMGDFEEGPISGTVSEMYDCTGLPTLRVYLICTKKRLTGSNEHKNDDLEDKVESEQSTEQVENKKMEENVEQENAKAAKCEPPKAAEPGQHALMNESIDCENPQASTSFASSPFNEPLVQEDLFENVLSDDEITFLLPNMHSHNQKREVDLNVKLKRGSVLEEFIDWVVQNQNQDFNTIKVEITLLRSDGNEETGEDNGGVFRDTLSEFWADFYTKYTSGDLMKVPEIVHTMGQQRWRAVAVILFLGYRQVGYYPVQLALPFMMNCMFDNCAIGSLTDAFLNFMSATDRAVVTKALEDFSSVSGEDLIDAFEDFNLKRLITKNNINAVIDEIAHAKLIQEPAFVSDIWRTILMVNLRPLIGSMDDLQSLYQKLVPTNRRILDLLSFPECDPNSQEESLGQWLRKLIKGFSDNKCLKFLRFCTGSDLIVVREIQVRYTPAESDFSRRIIAHTCGCVLEIPKGEHSYSSFNELRSEVEKILDSGYLAMDIV